MEMVVGYGMLHNRIILPAGSLHLQPCGQAPAFLHFRFGFELQKYNVSGKDTRRGSGFWVPGSAFRLILVSRKDAKAQ
jgi:hypothetical protein